MVNYTDTRKFSLIIYIFIRTAIIDWVYLIGKHNILEVFMFDHSFISVDHVTSVWRKNVGPKTLP